MSDKRTVNKRYLYADSTTTVKGSLVFKHFCVFELGLCDMDKKYISRFFYFFFDFDFNHDFDTNRHALSYTSCFCTSYLFLHILLVLHILFCTFLYSITHFTLYFIFLPIYICSCVVLLLYNFYSLHCPLSGPDLIYISLLIIPCIIYHVTNKGTLTFTVINALCEFETYFQRKPISFPKKL